MSAQSTNRSRSYAGRLAAVTVALVAAFSLLAGTARAGIAGGTTQPFIVDGNSADPGYLGIYATCDRTTRRGYVSLDFMTPNALTSGLWVETKIYAKNRTQAWSSAVVIDSRQQFARTVTSTTIPFVSSPVIQNTPVTLVTNAAFSGVAWNYYDVGIYFRVAKPGLPWSGWMWVTAKDYTVIVNSYGARLNATTCMF